MLGGESEESDNEGFVSHQIRIDSQSVELAEKEERNSQDFQPRYISGQGLLKKEPPECHSPYRNIPIRSKATINTNVITVDREQLQTVCEVYKNTKEYCLVYSRFKEPFGSGVKSAFQHEIRLNCNQTFPEQSQNSRTLRPWKQQHLSEDITTQSSLIFDSRFESGNLRSAFRSRRDPNSYTLFMQNDTNTYGFNQWFYFSIRNAKKGIKYTFKIANYKKSYSFFTRGMQPLVFSLKKAREGGNGWYRDGSNISYYPSNYKQDQCATYYTLQFQLSFQEINDYLTLSPYPPYSFSRLISTIKRVEHTARKNDISLKLKIVGHSLVKNPIFCITLSLDDTSNKSNIVVLARQHSGQSWSSFLAEKLMQQLVEQKSESSKWTLQNYNVCVFPMVNVDGVIYGNFRCDLVGYDLNRCWKQTVNSIHPQIYSIHREICLLSKKSGIQLCMDLHTHSKDFGAFAYCCVQSENCKALPLLISKISPIFRFPACTFGISAQKQNTARSTVFSLTHNINTLTIELSAFGFKKSKKGMAKSYTPEHIEHIANSIIGAFYAYATKKDPVIPKEQLALFREDDRQGVVELGKEDGEQEHQVDGSDSQPDIDEIAVQIKLKRIFPASIVEQLANAQGKNKQNIIKTLKKKQRNKKTSHKTIFQKQLPPQPKITPQLNESIELLPYHEQRSRMDNEVFQKKNTVASPQAIKPPKIYSNKPRYLKHSRERSEKSTKEVQRPIRGLNLIQFSLKKLPLFPLDKIAIAGSNLVIDEGNLLLLGNYAKRQNRFDKTFSTYEAMCRPRVRNTSKQLMFFKQKPNLQQQLPYLCIMSQTKKQLQIQKMNQKISQRQQLSKNQTRTYHNSILNGHRPQNAASISKYRQRRKNIDALSKIRMSPYTRYEQIIKKQ